MSTALIITKSQQTGWE